MDTTWKIWHALNHPPYANSLFKHLTRLQNTPRNVAPGRIWVMLMVIPPLVSMVALYSSSRLSLLTFMLFLATPALLFITITLYGSFYGCIWAMRICEAIAQQRRRGLYELLCLFTHGEPGANWMLCVARMYNQRGLERQHERRSWMMPLVMTVALITAFVVVGMQFENSGRYPNDGLALLLLTGVYFLGILTALHIDYAQSLVLASLVGMIIPTMSQSQTEARLWSFGSFVALQAVTYALAAAMGMFVAPIIVGLLPITDWLIATLVLVARLVIFYGIRECVVVALWGLLAQRLNSEAAELDAVLRIAI